MQQILDQVKTLYSYHAIEGDKFTSNNQGFKFSSIKTSKPYISKNENLIITSYVNSILEKMGKSRQTLF